MKFLAHISVSIILVLLLAYLPFSGFLFALKNDAFTAYFPVKHFMSESLHAGQFPWWNPYLNYGLPQYADMSSAFWNPVTLLFATTIGYNPYTYTLEELLYILLAGIFMYRLCSYWTLPREIKLITAISYACCGFIVGHLQHFNWISGAAWLPFAFHAYLLACDKPTLKHMVTAGLAFYLFGSSAHPGLLIGAFYFFLIVFLARLYELLRSHKPDLSKVLMGHLIMSAVFLLMGWAMLMSWSEIMHEMDRGTRISLAASQVGPTPIWNWISFLLPFSITQSPGFFNNDVALRNVYMGLPLLILLCYATFKEKSKWQTLFLLTGLLFFLLSMGGIFKQLAYYILPFLGYVRLDGEFRIFGLFCWIIAAAIAMKKFVQSGWKIDRDLRLIYRLVAITLVIGIVAGMVRTIQTDNGILANFPSRQPQSGFAGFLKQIVDSIRFHDTLMIQGSIQLIFLFLTWRSFKNKSISALAKIAAADLIMATLLNVPFTGVGQTSLKTVSAMVSRAPKGFPIPDLKPIGEHSTISPSEEKIIGNWGFYNKEIGSPEFMPYPVLLKSTRKFYESPEKSISDQKAFAYFDHHATEDSISITHFLPGLFEFNVRTVAERKLVLKQNQFRGWQCTLDDKAVDIEIAEESFISVLVPPGSHQVKFVFEKPLMKAAAWISLISFCAGLIILLLPSPPIRREKS